MQTLSTHTKHYQGALDIKRETNHSSSLFHYVAYSRFLTLGLLGPLCELDQWKLWGCARPAILGGGQLSEIGK